MPQEYTNVTCPWCHKKNLLGRQETKGTYRCKYCQKTLLSDPFLSLSKPKFQALSTRWFSVRRTLNNNIHNILIAFAIYGALLFVRHYSGKGSSPTYLPPVSFPTPSMTISMPTPLSIPLTPQTTPSSEPKKPKPTVKPKSALSSKPVRLLTTECGGVPYPTKTGYLKKCPALSIGGYSSVSVDNSQNDSDVFVKLFTLSTTPPKAASVFFIRARDTFTVEDIQPGNYDVRYRNLTSNALSRTEQFKLKEIRTARGVEFSKIRLTLYKVFDGNMQVQPISEDEF